jgi:5-methylthioadenosine/S-adenosylhomocysteine deaminase
LKAVIRNARVLTMDPSGRELERATVTIEDGRITAVEEQAGVHAGTQGEDSAAERAADPAADSAADRDIDASGHLIMPGLINAHFHSSVNHLKGSLDSLPLEIFMLYESPPDGAAMDPRAVYVRTMLGALEMLRSGVTAVLDDAFFVPAPTPELIDAVMQAYQDSGIRAALALDQPNVPELDKLPFLADLLPPALRTRAAAPAAMDADGAARLLSASAAPLARAEPGATARRGVLLRATTRHA